MREVHTNRFKDAEWFGMNKRIMIGGVGGTGSWLSLFLSRTGNHELHLYDMDIYEEHNMAGQFVNFRQIGLKKVEVAKNNIQDFSGNQAFIFTYDKYDEESPTNQIVFACFDNMEARKIMYDKWKTSCLKKSEEQRKEYLFVDLRLLAESLTIIIVQGHSDDFERYEETLFLDSEVDAVDCTLKQTSHAAGLIASMTTGFFTNWLANRKSDSDYRDVPFRTDYYIGLNLMQNESSRSPVLS